MSTEFEKSMFEVVKKWVEIIGKSIDDDTPEPTPEPVPTPTPTPITKEPEIVYNGKSSYIIEKGETIKVTFWGLNSTNSNDFEMSGDGWYGAMPVFTKSLKETAIENGFRFDVTITGQNEGEGYITMSPYMCKDTTKIKTVKIKVK